MSSSQFPDGTHEVGQKTDFVIDYSICTLVSRPSLYAQMVQSFQRNGFTADRCEFLYIDNSGGNAGDGYTGLNRLLGQAKGRHVVLCHQDIIARDGIDQLDTCLAALTETQPDWAVAGNAGLDHKRQRFMRITDRNRLDFRSPGLPAAVETLDENFLVVRAETSVRFSRDLEGFHLYGTDLALQAAVGGHSVWVIDYHVEHLAKGTFDRSFPDCAEAFEAKYLRAFKPRALRTTATKVGVGKRDLESRLRRHKHRLELEGKKPLGWLRPIAKWLEHRPYDLHERRYGPNYTLDGVSYRIPEHSPYLARKSLKKGRYEAPERRAVQQFLPRDCPVIELGGSFGIVSNTIRQTMDDTQPLVVVEAIPELAEICRANIRDAGRPTHLVSAALAYGADVISFEITGGIHTSHLASQALGQGSDQTARQVDVPATTLAKLRQQHAITGRYALVCDIEGAEFDLLQNEAAQLSDCDTIIMELHPPAYIDRNSSVTAMLDMLSQAGFEILDVSETVIVARNRTAA